MANNLRFQTTIFGGLNKNDQSDQLLLRSHSFSENGWSQIAPAECTEAINIDFDKRGIKKRLGSTLESLALYDLFTSGESIVNSIYYTSAATNDKISVVVTTHAIYTDYSGSYSQINDSLSASYTHNENITKSTFAVVDGHLFIGLNENNKIQVYRNGNTLDEELDNGNTYEEAFGTGTQTITGVWGVGDYLLADFQGRLIYSNGNTLVNYSTVPSASGGIWDRLSHGFYQTSGSIIALTTFTPDYQDSIQETLYIFTAQGPQITNDLTSQIQKIEEGVVPLSYKSFVATKSWLMVLTLDRQIIAFNRNVAIDIGRRFRDNSGVSDIDVFDIVNSELNAFTFYNRKREQVYFFVPERGKTYNSLCFVIDVQLAEPNVLGSESLSEKNVRLSTWKVSSDISYWYASLFSRNGDIIGITPSGKTYNFLNGKDDFTDTPVEAVYETMDFNAGASSISKQWMMLNLRGQFVGNYTTSVSYIIDKDDLVQSTATYNQTSSGSLYGQTTYGNYDYNSILLLKGQDDIDSYSESVRIKLENNSIGQTFRFDTIEIEYLMGTKDR